MLHSFFFLLHLGPCSSDSTSPPSFSPSRPSLTSSAIAVRASNFYGARTETGGTSAHTHSDTRTEKGGKSVESESPSSSLPATQPPLESLSERIERIETKEIDALYGQQEGGGGGPGGGHPEHPASHENEPKPKLSLPDGSFQTRSLGFQSVLAVHAIAP